MKSDLSLLFDDYVSLYGSSLSFECDSGQSYQSVPQIEMLVPSKTMSLTKARFNKYSLESEMGGSKRIKFNIYLGEATMEDEGNFNILKWWKLNSERFPILSHMARDFSCSCFYCSF